MIPVHAQILTEENARQIIRQTIDPFFERLENISKLAQDHDDFDVITRSVLDNYFSKDGSIYNDLTLFNGDPEEVDIETYFNNINFYYRNEKGNQQFTYSKDNIAVNLLMRSDAKTIDFFVDKIVRATYNDLESKKTINNTVKVKIVVQWKNSLDDAKIIFIRKDSRQEFKNATLLSSLNKKKKSSTVSEVANDIALKIAAANDVVTREGILHQFTYHGQDVINDFSNLFKTILKTYLDDKGVKLTHATRDFAARVFTVKGEYAKKSDKLQIKVRIYDERGNEVYQFDNTDLDWNNFKNLIPEGVDDARIINQDVGPDKSSSIQMIVTTNKGEGNQQFRSGEQMDLAVRLSKPCYIRVFYLMADGSVMLMVDTRQNNTSSIEQHIALGSFICTPPFGLETLVALASETFSCFGLH